VKVGEGIQDQHIKPVFCTNDEAFELRTVLAGEVIAQLAAPSAAVLIRAGRLVPLLLEHVADTFSMYVYFGSRAAVPARVRRFIDLAVERLTDSPDFVLSAEELARANARGLAQIDKDGS
jgi:DNA-binding transcriptional LysR family regulator